MTSEDREKFTARFTNIHLEDKNAVKDGRVARLDKNDAHLQGYNSEKSVLDVPFSITDIVERGVPQPKVTRFLRKRDGTGRYKRIYEIGFDQFMERRHPSDHLNCSVVQIILDFSNQCTAAEQGKNFCLPSFSLHEEFSLPLDPNGCVSTPECITKVWTNRTKCNNHRAFFFCGKIPRPLDNRPLGTKTYTQCLAFTCYSCRPEITDKATASQPPSQQTAMSTWGQAAATTLYAGHLYTTGASTSYEGANYTSYPTAHTTGYKGDNYNSYPTAHTTGYKGDYYNSYPTVHTTGYGGDYYTSYPPPPLHPAPETPTTPPPPGMERKAPEVNQQSPLHLTPSTRNMHIT